MYGKRKRDASDYRCLSAGAVPGNRKHKAEMLLNFCIRSVMGGIVILGVNTVLANWGIPCAVGLNPWSLLTSGTLGFSGVSLLYAVAAIRLL